MSVRARGLTLYFLLNVEGESVSAQTGERRSAILPCRVEGWFERGAADEQALAEAGNTAVHRVQKETQSFVRTQSWAVTAQTPYLLAVIFT